MLPAVHCADCATRFGVSNPVGRIYLNVTIDEQYHLALEDNGPAGATVCGLPTDDFDSTVGTIGVELSSGDLLHRWLRERGACPRCFENVW